LLWLGFFCAGAAGAGDRMREFLWGDACIAVAPQLRDKVFAIFRNRTANAGVAST